jgi:outer membrane murein-binding lipoprotein Lpp
MKKVLIVFIVIVLMLSTCGCGKVDELESENAKLKEDIAELESNVAELEDQEKKLSNTIKYMQDDEARLQEKLDDANKKLEELESAQALMSDTGLGFTAGEHFSYFMMQINKTSLFSDWKMSLQYKMPEYVTNSDGKGLVGYKIQNVVYDDLMSVIYGNCPDGKHVDSIMIQAEKKDDNAYNNQYLELGLDILYALVDFKIDMKEWKEADKNNIINALINDKEYDGVKIIDAVNKNGYKVRLIKLTDN